MMRVELVKTSRAGGWSIGLVVCGLVWVAVVAAAHFLPGGPTLCVFKRVTDLPCPTCGATRCAVSLLSGQFAAAISFNPLLLVVALGAGAALALRTCFARRVSLGLTGRQRLGAWILAVAAAAGNWAYLICAGI